MLSDGIQSLTNWELVRALWYFIGPERRKFAFFSALLLTILCYTVVPPLIIGSIANFLIEYVRADASAKPSLTPQIGRAHV